MEEAALSGVNTEELEAKRKARMERFGAAEVKVAKNKKANNAGGDDNDDEDDDEDDSDSDSPK